MGDPFFCDSAKPADVQDMVIRPVRPPEMAKEPVLQEQMSALGLTPSGRRDMLADPQGIGLTPMSSVCRNIANTAQLTSPTITVTMSLEAVPAGREM